MTLSYAGYDGTVNELQWALMHSLTDAQYACATTSDLACTDGGSRRISTAPGTAFGYGVLVQNSAAILTVIPSPAAGQWFLVCLRRDWVNNNASIVAIAATTGADAAAGTPPNLPTKGTAGGSAFTGNPGVLDDQPLAWVWARASTTALAVTDVRTMPLETRLSGSGQQLTAASTTPQALATGATTPVAVLFTTLTLGAYFTYSAGTFTCIKACNARASGAIEFAANATGNRYAAGAKSTGGGAFTPGPQSQGAPSATTFLYALPFAFAAAFAVGDQFRVQAMQTSGGALNVTQASLALDAA